MNYKVYQGSELKQTVTSKTAVINGLQPNQTYVFGVQPDNGRTGSVGANLIIQSDLKYGCIFPDGSLGSNTVDFHSDNYIPTNGATVFTFSSPDYALKLNGYDDRIAMYDSDKNYLGYQPLDSPTQTLSQSNVAYIRFCINSEDEGNTTGNSSDWLANHRYKLEKGSVATTYVATTSVTTRGIRFNIPKTLTVGSTITLRYEEYPLGIVPIGTEPSGMFGGGNKQNLSAKVISTANGSSVVEVSGNVIEVGGRNLYTDTLNFSNPSSWWGYGSWTKTTDTYNGLAVMQSKGDWNGISQYVQVKKGDTVTYDAYAKYVSGTGISMIYWALNNNPEGSYSTASSNPSYNDVTITDSWQRVSCTTVATSDGYLRPRIERNSHNTNILQIAGIKVEPGTIATPYASFVDGDTFTAQPDGTFALFSEYKALYY